jgi:hypothetical protein
MVQQDAEILYNIMRFTNSLTKSYYSLCMAWLGWPNYVNVLFLQIRFEMHTVSSMSWFPVQRCGRWFFSWLFDKLSVAGLYSIE